MILKAQGSLTVVDTGSYGDRQMLLRVLAAKDIPAESVDKVMITHLHFDHYFNTDVFLQTEILIGAKEWKFAHSQMPS